MICTDGMERLLFIQTALRLNWLIPLYFPLLESYFPLISDQVKILRSRPSCLEMQPREKIPARQPLLLLLCTQVQTRCCTPSPPQPLATPTYLPAPSTVKGKKKLKFSQKTPCLSVPHIYSIYRVALCVCGSKVKLTSKTWCWYTVNPPAAEIGVSRRIGGGQGDLS